MVDDTRLESRNRRTLKDFWLDYVIFSSKTIKFRTSQSSCFKKSKRLKGQNKGQMAQAQGITEDLKAQDQVAWGGAMNNIRNAAEEIVFAELIFN